LTDFLKKKTIVQTLWWSFRKASIIGSVSG